MATVSGLASGRYIPNGGRPDFLSPQGVSFHWIAWRGSEMRSAILILTYYDWLSENLERSPFNWSVVDHIERLLRAHSLVIGMRRETIEAGIKSQRFK